MPLSSEPSPAEQPLVGSQNARHTSAAETRRSRGTSGHIRHFGVGAATGCTSFALLIDAIRFVSYPVLALLAFIAGVIGLSVSGRRLLRVAVMVLGCTTAALLFTPLVGWAVDAFDVSQPPPQRADALVVLGAGLHCSTGQLDATSLARVTSAISLWRAGVAPLIAISDSDPTIRPAGCPSQATVQRTLIESLAGPDGPDVFTLPPMRTTATEAAAVANLQRQRGWKQVVVVTSPVHTRRARDIFRRAGVDAVVVASSEPQFDGSFSRPTHRTRALGQVVREIAGTAKAKLG